MIYTAKLTGSDIVTIIAQHFKVERKAVTLTAHSGFNGGPTDSQAPYVDAEVTLPEPKSLTDDVIVTGEQSENAVRDMLITRLAQAFGIPEDA